MFMVFDMVVACDLNSLKLSNNTTQHKHYHFLKSTQDSSIQKSFNKTSLKDRSIYGIQYDTDIHCIQNDVTRSSIILSNSDSV